MVTFFTVCGITTGGYRLRYTNMFFNFILAVVVYILVTVVFESVVVFTSVFEIGGEVLTNSIIVVIESTLRLFNTFFSESV